TAQISFGNALTPAISALVSVLQSATDWFNGLSKGMQSFVAISLAVTTVIMGIVAALGFLMLGVGQMISGLGTVSGLLKGLIKSEKFIKVLGVAFGALTSPIGLTVLGITAVGAALVIAYKKSEKFRNFVNGA
ncbi:hypothetical protein, partial [Bacillus licheniformis]